jgi:hypothetical protein
MAQKTWRRPQKAMMLAVNASIDGDEKLSDQIITEHRLDRKEFLVRMETRNGERYTFTRSPNGSRTAIVPAEDIISKIDGRTKIITLIRLVEKVEFLLQAKPEEEVAKVRAALAGYEKKRSELKEMEALLGI